MKIESTGTYFTDKFLFQSVGKRANFQIIVECRKWKRDKTVSNLHKVNDKDTSTASVTLVWFLSC